MKRYKILKPITTKKGDYYAGYIAELTEDEAKRWDSCIEEVKEPVKRKPVSSKKTKTSQASKKTK